MEETIKQTLCIGLMTGTSVDGIDAAILDFSVQPYKTVATHSHPIPDELKKELHSLCIPGDNEIDRMGQADAWLGEVLAEAANTLIEKAAGIDRSQILAIGCHGQTIRHRPSYKHPFTLQIGDSNRVTELTGITVIGDLRRRDIAAGGQGAPLAPGFHLKMFHSTEKNRVLVNIGGISNVTFLYSSETQKTSGFDTGPGNTLMDAWIRKHQGKNFDKDGKFAQCGTLNQSLLDLMLQDSYFSKSPPKSTGREQFDLFWLEEKLKGFDQIKPQDVQMTLVHLTAKTIADQIKLPNPEILICGGGRLNPVLMKTLSHYLQREAKKTEEYGIDGDFIEAGLCAWIAYQTINGLPSNVTAVTGAKGQRVLGGVYGKK